MARTWTSWKEGGRRAESLTKTLKLLEPSGSTVRQRDLKGRAAKQKMAWSTVKRALHLGEDLFLVIRDKDIDERGHPVVTYRSTRALFPNISPEMRESLRDIERLPKKFMRGQDDLTRGKVAAAYVLSELSLMEAEVMSVLLGVGSCKSEAEARDLMEVLLSFYLRRRLSTLSATLWIGRDVAKDIKAELRGPWGLHLLDLVEAAHAKELQGIVLVGSDKLGQARRETLARQARLEEIRREISDA